MSVSTRVSEKLAEICTWFVNIALLKIKMIVAYQPGLVAKETPQRIVSIAGAQVAHFACPSLHVVLMKNINLAFAIINESTSFSLDPAPLLTDEVNKLMTASLQSISYHEYEGAVSILGNIFLS